MRVSFGVDQCAPVTLLHQPIRKLILTEAKLMAIQAQGTDMKRPLISIRNVSLSYGNFQALTDVSVDFHQGEMVGLVGDNGAGKTALIRIISGIMPPTSGEVYFDGERSRSSIPRKPSIWGWNASSKRSGYATTCRLDAIISSVESRRNVSLAYPSLTRRRSGKPAQK